MPFVLPWHPALASTAVSQSQNPVTHGHELANTIHMHVLTGDTISTAMRKHNTLDTCRPDEELKEIQYAGIWRNIYEFMGVVNVVAIGALASMKNISTRPYKHG